MRHGLSCWATKDPRWVRPNSSRYHCSCPPL
jgi:hypothetical protein